MKTTGEDIFKALENADEHFIEECRQSGSGVKIKTVWTKWAAVAACGVIAAATGVMMFAGRSDKDIKAKAAADQQMADEEATVSYRVPWDEYAMKQNMRRLNITMWNMFQWDMLISLFLTASSPP